MNKLAKTLSLVAMLTTTIALVLPAYAADSYSVVLQRAELNTVAGLQQVHSRMLQVAKDYCPTYQQIRSRTDVATCIDGVVQDLTEKIADERLSGYVASMERLSTMHRVAQQFAY